MPMYEFCCDDCGSFELRRSFSQAADAATCPHCAASSRRVFSAPHLACMTERQRTMLNRQEQGATPRLERRAAPEEHAGHKHAGHSHGRPWMLGH